jgi:hypothetical protein
MSIETILLYLDTSGAHESSLQYIDAQLLRPCWAYATIVLAVPPHCMTKSIGRAAMAGLIQAGG